MSATSARTTTNRRSNGQWAIDGRTPLNPNEEFKQTGSSPLEVRERIETIYARQGFDSIPSDDLHGRMRWWGLYTQRAEGIDGHRTGTLGPDEMSGRHFMMRVRLDGTSVSPAQLRVLGGISNDFARGTADLTDRQNLQYHWIEIESVPEIWRRLESAGLQTIEACGDTPRGFLLSPVAGVAADEIIDPSPMLETIGRRYLGRPEIANLPRKFKTAATGHPSLDIAHEINDLSFVGVHHPELGPGFDLWVAGGLSTTPRLGERLGAFCTAELGPDVWYATIRLFRDYGYRRLRNRARLKFLLADWGVERFRQVLQDEYLGYELPDGPAPARSVGNPDHVGVHEQKDGLAYIGLAPSVGRLSGDVLIGLAEAMEAAGSARVRLTPHQKLVVLDVEPGAVENFLTEVAPLGLTARPGPFRRSTMSCTGIEFCKFAFVETKATAAALTAELDRRFEGAGIDTPISLSINGCPNSCVRIQLADIGLKGQLARTSEGSEFAYQVHLGGGLATMGREEAGFGRTVRGLRITADEAADYVERIVRRYLGGRAEGETFAQWSHRASDDELR
ncbi:nitrite/sulfite reductase [Propionibacterium australiense]|uniref:assimilatory sulfite reductase (ferredoxin) n=1 Tax=Propionibacterium australiense TaxID=119981 RepID=A0A383S6J1_9ACTN|nr:nitrite/sulfite reductase [Propionibacterium australiense]RLP08524.1 nitrite/sulfite reductase [Propionibacterium australiense]RLP08593.1 nitrite/sulfite reductase [Propionibacterium australiense]SYZ33625.1 Nitrite/Sulfite reductase ferredoxin-like half domain [Propionibacterium australiense]VEH88824.1 Sulfite reductase [ferredoxin] [Propionibacterium australiense]